MTIDKADKTYTGCDKCVHANDSEDVCRARLCIHAINHLKECYKPVRPRGHWIEQDGWDGDVYYECSVCSEPFVLIDGTPTDNLYNYCPNCGARMEVSE